MPRLLFLSLFSFLLLAKTWGQGHIISGRVLNEDKAGIPFATVALRLPDSTLVVGTAADANGRFALKARQSGPYMLVASAIGYSSKRVFITLPTDSPITLNLQPATVEMATQVVEGRRQLIEQQAGKTIINVENSITTKGVSALDVLRRAPGVTADNSGNISLKGRGNVLVLIDNKPTLLQASDLGQLLKSLSANQLTSIELITNPSAEYDAQGTAGIINLNLKKNARLGMGASVDLTGGTGQYYKSNGTVSGYYNTRGLNLSSAYSYQQNQNFNDYRQNRIYPQGDLPDYQAFLYNIETRRNHNVRFQADYDLNLATTIGLSGNALLGNERNNANNRSTSYLKGQEVERTQTANYNPDKVQNYSGRLSVSHRFGSDSSRAAGLTHTLNSYVDVAAFQRQNPQTTFFQFFFPNQENDSTWRLQSKLRAQNVVGVAQLDYKHIPSKGFGFETGGKLTAVIIESDPELEFRDRRNNIIPFITQRSRFRYQEQIGAAYGIAHYKWQKWQLKAGLRTEHWNALGKQLIDNTQFTRDQWFWLPSASASVILDTNNAISLSFGTRIDRPGYGSLNPIPFYGDPYTIFRGNPTLRPQVADNFELSHTLFQGLFITTLNYNNTRNLVADYTLSRPAQGQTVQDLSPQNIASQVIYGLSASYNPRISRNIQAQLYGYLYRSEVTGNYQDYELNNRTWSYQGNASLQFTLGRGWQAEASFWGQSRQPESVGIQGGMMSISGGIQKALLKEKGSLKLAVQDAFYTTIYTAKTDLGTVRTNNSYRWDNRQVLLTFSYSISRGVKADKPRQDAPADERIR